NAELGLTDADCIVQHSLKHRLELARGARDDAQHLGGGLLLLQRLSEFAPERDDVFVFEARCARRLRATGRRSPRFGRNRARSFFTTFGHLGARRRPVNYLPSGSRRRMVATSRSNSTGLVSNSSQPAASAFSRDPPSACAESAMIGMSRVCGSALSRRLAPHPAPARLSRPRRLRPGGSESAMQHPFPPSSATPPP